MYSVLLSKIEYGFDLIKEELEKRVSKNSKVSILPWAFPIEIDSNELENDFFKEGGKRYNKYVNPLKELGIDENNIIVCNCYSDSKEKLKKIIKESDILVLPGGNPEMFFKKVVHDTEILYNIKYFSGIIIGESAGAELQLKRYFISAKNNYYKYFAFYDGFGVLDDPFYFDVHSINNKFYLDNLQKIANDRKKDVYAIYDNGAIIYNRNKNIVKTLGNVDVFKPNNSNCVNKK